MKLRNYLLIVAALFIGGCASQPQEVELKDEVKKLTRNVIYINLKTGEIKGD